ncbi:MAG: hypothetical protein M1840_009054 [Geoglossum simile]|nr:MAG: hypothetical protein M1840_009054 [Geoglossum simile]
MVAQGAGGSPSKTGATRSASSTTPLGEPAPSSSFTTPLGELPSVTTATPSASLTVQPTSAKSRAGVSAGGVAGVAVGVGVAAALLGVIVTFYLFRRFHKPRRSDPSSTDEPKDPEPVSLDKHLPQPAEDSKLCDNAEYLSELINQHVLNFYHLSKVSSADLKALDAAVPKEKGFRGVGVGVLAEAETRFVGLRQYLAAMIVLCVAPRGSPEYTLLPSEEVAFLKAMPERHRDPGESMTLTLHAPKFDIVTNPPPPPLFLVFSEAYNQWRVLSSYLLRSTTATATSSSSKPTALDRSIRQVFDTINHVLLPFAVAETETDRQQGLSDILQTAAELGRLLFAQKEEWVFSWALRGKRGKYVESGRGVVVFPALVKGGQLVRPLGVERV